MTIDLLAAATATFDPDAATRAYLATLQGAARARSDAYFEGGYWIALWDGLVAALAYWLMLHLGWSAKWSAWASRVTRRPALQAGLYAIPFSVVGALLLLPWGAYTGYFREHQYSMSNQTFPAWLGELAIGAGVNLVFMFVLFAIVFAVIRKAPRTWWLWATGTIVALMVFLVMLSPLFVEPLFNKYTPMKDGPVKAEILRIAHEQEIPTNDVYVVDASRQTKRISANVAGLGPTIRIALNDNLLNRSNLAGIKSVMGHEMGHYKLHHVWKLIGYFSLIALLAAALLKWGAPPLLARYGDRWKVKSVSDPAVAPLFGLLIALYLIPADIAFNSVIRHHESEADAFGLEAAREPDGFAMTAMQLSEYRKIEPGKWEEILFYDHPSGRTRVQMAMDWKAKHLKELPVDQQRAFVMTADQPAK
ncbi:M48 family metallopeptidase [Sphingomonas jaspsi]|uniref:M48 family metallopeptidase n=1 Tax=Sphingomonas jaspsi TaxID=392409 RepID=UPI0004B88987|nr:M48 family metallopeptidase [Sphingomonas jaspsi]